MTGRSGVIDSALPDEEVIIRILGGDNRQFEVLMRRYNQRLYRTGLAILQNETEAEDAMQAAYISAYEHLNSFQRRSSFSTWLTRIMVNQCLEQKRKKKLILNGLAESDNAIHMKTPSGELINKELNAILERSIGQLPEKYRLVFVLREIEAMSVRETSEALNIEEPNVKVRLNRAKTMLRETLGGYMKDNVYSFHLSKCDRIVDRVFNKLGLG